VILWALRQMATTTVIRTLWLIGAILVVIGVVIRIVGYTREGVLYGPCGTEERWISSAEERGRIKSGGGQCAMNYPEGAESETGGWWCCT